VVDVEVEVEVELELELELSGAQAGALEWQRAQPTRFCTDDVRRALSAFADRIVGCFGK
jgi:hypothetical protein